MQSELLPILQENPFLLKRRELIAQIESALATEMGGNPAVTSYIANTLNPGLSSLTAMNLAHIAYVDDLVRGASENGTRPVALVIESYGGEATFPLEIIHRAKTYCKEFYVIAINVAKSAATLLALLADRIVAVETASFGPVDPQIVITTPQGAQLVSAKSVKEMMETTIPDLTSKMTPAERAIIFASQNYLLFQQSLDALKLVDEIMDKQLGRKLPAAKLKEVKQRLLNTPASHSLNVSAQELLELGFDVRIVKPNTDLGRLLIEYHRRALRALLAEAPPGNSGLVLFESRRSSLTLNAAMVQVVAQSQTQQAPPKQAGA